MNLRIVLVVAQLTLREITRRRILWVLTILSLVSVVLVGWGVNRMVSLARGNDVNAYELEIGVSQILILIAFMFSFVLAMSAAFLAAPAIASDVETGTVLAMLARPMHRADLVVGRWLGLGLVVASGSLGELLGESAVRLRVGGLPLDRSPLAAFGPLSDEDGWLVIRPVDPARIPDIVATAVTLGGRVHAVDPGRMSLEELFLDLVRGAAPSDPATPSGPPPAPGWATTAGWPTPGDRK